MNRALLFLYLLFLSIVFSGCEQTQKEETIKLMRTQSEEDFARKFFKDSVSQNNIFYFMHRFYPEYKTTGISNVELYLTYAFEEEYRSEFSINEEIKMVRITIIPFGSHPMLLKAELRNGLTYLTAKILSGSRDFDNFGYLKSSITEIHSDSLFKELEFKLGKVSFWNFKEPKRNGILHGTDVIIEVFDNDKYKKYERIQDGLMLSDSENVFLTNFILDFSNYKLFQKMSLKCN